MSYDKITKVTEDVYLEAVRKYRTINDTELAKKTGVARTSIWRFRSKNQEIYAKAKQIIAGFDSVTFSTTSVNEISIFKQFPIVSEWVEIQEKKGSSGRYITDNISALFNVCNALGVHPANLDIDMVSDKMYAWRKLEDAGLEYPSGCAYNTVRKGIRSFMTIQLGVTGEQLTIKGIGAEHSKGFGLASRERILKEQRETIIREMPNAVKNVCDRRRVQLTTIEIDNIIKEMRAICIFMYYTATRITATLDARFNDNKNVFRTGYWEIHVLDKGKRGGIHWQKRLMDDGHKKMSEYVADRFGISVENQNSELMRLDSALFPSLDYKNECLYMREALDIAGVHTKSPNHIWRHTFAQDWLHAMDGNYEVGAEIGGWKDIGTMKRCYGAVSESIVKRGLAKAMGLPVIEEDNKLLF